MIFEFLCYSVDSYWFVGRLCYLSNKLSIHKLNNFSQKPLCDMITGTLKLPIHATDNFVAVSAVTEQRISRILVYFLHIFSYPPYTVNSVVVVFIPNCFLFISFQLFHLFIVVFHGITFSHTDSVSLYIFLFRWFLD